jgi:hypothetical protein
MTNLTARTLEASIKTIPQDSVSALRAKVRGTVALRGEDGLRGRPHDLERHDCATTSVKRITD